MIKQIRIYSLGIILLATACKCHKDQASGGSNSSGTTANTSDNSGSNTTASSNAIVSAPDTARLAERKAAIMSMPKHRLVVSFISIGAGIAADGKEKLETYVTGAERKYGVAIARVNGYWGREGETDVVFSLKELNEKQQKEFIDGLRELFKGNQLILIEENREPKSYRQ